MDLLGDYSDDSDIDKDEAPKQTIKSNAAPVVKLPAPQLDDPPAPSGLPNPFAPAGSTVKIGTSSSPGLKRPLSNVTGHSLAAAQSSKSQKASEGSAASAKPGSAALLPPQLRGRANVVTEDLDRLFTKKQAAAAAAKQAQQQVLKS